MRLMMLREYITRHDPWEGAKGTLLIKLTTDRQTARYPRDLLSNSNRGRNPELHELIAQKAPDRGT
jgi:hypothetical protein